MFGYIDFFCIFNLNSDMGNDMNTYALPKDSNAWQHAVDSVAHLLPVGAASSIQSLKQLPVFAIVLVVSRVAMNDLEVSGRTIDEIMQTWANEQKGWQAVAVADDKVAVANAHRVRVSETLTDVSVYRYLLIPTDNKEMNADKREAVAHIIDEQLTTYLRKILKPKPNYNFQVDNAGQVLDLAPEQLGQAKKRHVDVHILSVAQMLRRHKLVCFDMDSTLIGQEVIVELADMAGVADKVSEITESAMRGEIDFNESFAKRVALLGGVDVAVVDKIINERITFSDGAFAIVAALKELGCRTVLISGGFLPFAKYVADSLGIDKYYANPLVTMGGRLTGSVGNDIIDGRAKARIVARLADEMSIDMEEVVCVGDGANDLPMMGISDIGVAYKAKPIVRAKADAAVNITGLEGVLYALGHRFDKV